MRNILASIPDEHFEMLNDIIDEVNSEENPTHVTVGQYVSNIVKGWIESQMRGEYLTYVKGKSLDELTTKIGKAKDLKKARKAKK